MAITHTGFFTDSPDIGDAIAFAVIESIADAELDANRHLRFVVFADGHPDHIYDAIANISADPIPHG